MDKGKVAAGAFLAGTFVILAVHLAFPRWLPPFIKMGIPRSTQTILLVGSDISYDGHTKLRSTGRSDTIMVIQVQPTQQKLQLLSIPRDTFIPIEGYGYQKINAAFALGGIDLLRKTVESLTGLTMDRYLIMRPDTVSRLIDKMGGVRVFVEKRMYYVDNWGGLKIDLQPGWQWLNGYKLQGYLRFRHEAMGDIARIGRQQDFLEEIASGQFRPRFLFLAPRALRALPGLAITNMRFREIFTVANFARMIPKENFAHHVVPGVAGPTPEGLSVWRADFTEMRKIIQQNFLHVRNT